MHSSLSPTACKKGGVISDFSLVPLSSCSSLEQAHSESLSPIMDEYYLSHASSKAPPSGHEKKKEQLQNRLSTQLAALEDAQKQAQECMHAGNSVMQNSASLEKLASEINSMRAKKTSWEEIALALKKKKIEMEKTGSVVYVEL